MKGFSTSKITGKLSVVLVENADMEFKDVFVPDENKLANVRDFT